MVFYVADGPKSWGRYLEATKSGWMGTSGDPPKNSGCYGISIPGASGTAIGSGKSNSDAILAACSELNTAVRFADDLVYGGKTDWFLPSKDELDAMYRERFTVGGFRFETFSQPYSTSTFPDAFTFVGQLFTDNPSLNHKAGEQFLPPRMSPYFYYVRPIRYGS